MTALALLPCVLYLAVYTPSSRALSTVVTGAVLVGGAVGWGLFLRGLRERTEQARTEAALRAEHARQREREAIAHEMHDTLAHRLSLLSVHAGALQVNPGAPTEQVQQAAGVIHDSAHQALEELQQLPLGQFDDLSAVLGLRPCGTSSTPSPTSRPRGTHLPLPRLTARTAPTTPGGSSACSATGSGRSPSPWPTAGPTHRSRPTST